MLRPLSTLMLLAALSVPANAAEFENPDGRPGTVGVEPFFSYYDSRTATLRVPGRQKEELDNVSSSFWDVGLSLLVPAHERVTVSARFDYSQQVFEQPIQVSGMEFDTQTTTPAFRVGLSVRFWLGNPRP